MPLYRYNRWHKNAKVVASVTPQIDALYDQALTDLEKWNLDKAEGSLRQIIEMEPEHALAWNKLGVVFARRKDLRQAEDCFNQAISLDSQLASPHSNLATSTRNEVGLTGPKQPTNVLWRSTQAIRPQPTTWVFCTGKVVTLAKESTC